MIEKKYVDRFWSKVEILDENACWEWTGANNGRYGQFWVNERLEQSHRVSWILHCGEIPEGLFVLHECDNPSCVNPDHLFLGTQKDNMRDAVKKGRLKNQKGANNNRVELTENQVLAIRAEYKTGKTSCRKLGGKHGKDYKHINNIINRKSWRHI